MFNVTVAAKFSINAKIKYMELQLIDLLSLGLMYMKKFTSFCQVLKKMHRKLVPFFCFTVYMQTSKLPNSLVVINVTRIHRL